MKQFSTLFTTTILFFYTVSAQYFQGSFSADPTDATNLKVAFKMRPTGNITTGISYLEAAFRCPSALAQTFTVNNIVSNTATFPGLSVQRFPPDYVAGSYTYIKFVFNTATVPATTYTSGTEYPLFTITTSLPANATPAFEMVSNLDLAQYQFGVVDAAGNFISPGAGPQLYGPGFSTSGSDQVVPLFQILPVTFKAFSVYKKGGEVQLTWTVDNQDASASHFEVERSTDGIAFQRIANIEVDFASGPSATYNFTDHGLPADSRWTMVYYRIKQVDKDGRYIYTTIHTVSNSAGGFLASLSPNPVLQHASISFSLPAASKISIRIINASGNAVLSTEIPGVAGRNQASVDVSSLASGTYNLILEGEGSFQTLRFLKAR